MTEPAITPALIAKHGLTPDEYARIQTILGRAPNFTELGIFSVMWSEHCSYKNSKRELRKFPTTGPTVLVKAGEENAGVIDIGDGRGRDHPRHFHDGRAPRFLAGLSALRADPRRHGAAQVEPLALRRRGERHRALRELHRRAGHRR